GGVPARCRSSRALFCGLHPVHCQRIQEEDRGMSIVSEETSSARLEDICVEPRLPIPMRDGTILRANVIRPRMPGRYPVVVERTPYDLALRVDDGALFAHHGYVYVAQHVGGRFGSGGGFAPWRGGGGGTGRDDGARSEG